MQMALLERTVRRSAVNTARRRSRDYSNDAWNERLWVGRGTRRRSVLVLHLILHWLYVVVCRRLPISCFHPLIARVSHHACIVPPIPNATTDGYWRLASLIYRKDIAENLWQAQKSVLKSMSSEKVIQSSPSGTGNAHITWHSSKGGARALCWDPKVLKNGHNFAVQIAAGSIMLHIQLNFTNSLREIRHPPVLSLFMPNFRLVCPRNRVDSPPGP